MQNQRRVVTLLRWVMFLALAYLVWASAGGDPLLQIGLLTVVAFSNVVLGRLSPGLWEHPALLPAIALVDISVLTTSMVWGQGFARDFFFAYFVLLAVVAMTPTLRWATAGTVGVVTVYGGMLALQHGQAFLQMPELMGRLGFLLSIGIGYGGLTEAGKIRLREAALRGELTGWVSKLSAAFSDDFDAFDVIRQILLDVHSVYPAAARASVVHIRSGLIQVIGSSDDPEIRERPLDPTRYPELLAVIDRGEPLIISDMTTEPTLTSVRALMEDLRFDSLLLCPVNLNDKAMGHIVLRVARKNGHFSPAVVRTTQTVAEAIAVIFRQATVRETIERSERMEMVSQITTSVSHSFNNILSTVLLSAELLRKETARHAEIASCDTPPCDDESMAKFESIELAAKEGLTIVERLAAWTRLGRESGAPDHNRSAVIDPATLLDEAWRYARPHWLRREATRDLTLHLDVEPTRAVQGHFAELREVLLNLMINAIDAMPKGGMMTLGLEETNGRVCFAVRDTGVGMSEEDIVHAFEPLYSTKGSAGCGLGLTIARSVAHRHGGEISAESALGVGSKFCLWLPASDAEIAAATDRPSSEETASASTSRRVLLVEANHLVRDVMSRFLETSGLEVDQVDSVDDAEVMLGTNRRYTGLLVDAGGAADAGEAFLATLKAHDPDAPGRVIFYSTGALPPQLRALQSEYGCGFVDRSAGLLALTRELDQRFGSGPAAAA